jgi:hypothetical protein
MVKSTPPPDPEALLPPLLACLPAAFVSSLPPPALLPLLSPILRQRVQMLSDTSDSWLRLLCWDAEKAEEVLSRVDDAAEVSPVCASKQPIAYRRLDKETLRSRIPLPEYRLCVLYEWCCQDGDSGGSGWRVAELLPQDQIADENNTWSASISEADAQAATGRREEIRNPAERHETETALETGPDEDDYWARYDSPSGRTPSVKNPGSRPLATRQPPLGSDDGYFVRYADVQPALDNDDPDGQTEDTESSLRGNVFAQLIQQHHAERGRSMEQPRVNGSSAGADVILNHPRPSSVSSSGSDAVAKLEQEARTQSASEIGVKQHISTSIKTLYRLAQSTGITLEEFDQLVKGELAQLDSKDGD